jgi:hypothetical protein
MAYFCTQNSKTKKDMEVISIERSTYEELLTSFNSFVIKMKEMASRGNDKGLGDWLDNHGRLTRYRTLIWGYELET